MTDTPDDLREREIRKDTDIYLLWITADIRFLLRRLDETRAERDALQAKLDAAMRVIDAARELEFGAGFVTILTKGGDAFSQSLATYDAETKEPKE